ncbi:MAG: transposase [Nevskia sp.]|nr:transposase [Nevskia sp.]
MTMSRGFGVIDVALLGIIRRWYIRDPLREIARRLGISRNTVRRYLRAEITEPTYPERQSPGAIDKYAFQLSAMLKTEAAKSRKQRRRDGIDFDQFAGALHVDEDVSGDGGHIASCRPPLLAQLSRRAGSNAYL